MKHPRTPRRWRTAAAGQTRARQLRREATPAEALLWEQIRDRRLDGFKFRRQHSIGRFIVDFYCPARRLIVEIDGPVHAGQQQYDGARTEELTADGYTVVRWTNDQIAHNLAEVLEQLRALLGENDR